MLGIKKGKRKIRLFPPEVLLPMETNTGQIGWEPSSSRASLGWIREPGLKASCSSPTLPTTWPCWMWSEKAVDFREVGWFPEHLEELRSPRGLVAFSGWLGRCVSAWKCTLFWVTGKFLWVKPFTHSSSPGFPRIAYWLNRYVLHVPWLVPPPLGSVLHQNTGRE